MVDALKSNHLLRPDIQVREFPLEKLLEVASLDQEEHASSSSSASGTTTAQSENIALVCFSSASGEGHDRKNLDISSGLNTTEIGMGMRNLKAKKVVVLMSLPGAGLMPWIDQADAALLGFYPGEQGGNAFLDVLIGEKQPEGKLPVTIPKSWAQSDIGQMSEKQYPGIVVSPGGFLKDKKENVYYTEGLNVGYRWYEKEHVKPLFSFGFGLPGYGDPRVGLVVRDVVFQKKGGESTQSVKFCLKRGTSKRFSPGSEVLQLYAKPKVTGRTGRAAVQLVDFKRVLFGSENCLEVCVGLEEFDGAKNFDFEREWDLYGGFSLEHAMERGRVDVRGNDALQSDALQSEDEDVIMQ